MELHYLKINGLFGQFDYDLDFRKNIDSISIITAPNGYGKSTILKVIDYFFNKKFNDLLNIDFSNFEISFNNYEITVHKENNGICVKDKFNSYFYSQESFLEKNKNFSYKIRKNLPFLKKISSNQWLDNRDGEILTNLEVRMRYGYNLDESFDNISSDWLNSILEDQNVIFVETNRLVNADFNNISTFGSYSEIDDKNSAVRKLSNKILDLRQEIVQTQFHISMDQGSEFPERVMDLLSVQQNIDIETVTKKMIKISRFDKFYNKNEIFGNLGLKSNIISRLKSEEIYNNQSFLLVLNAYLEDIICRINYCSDLAERIQLFKNSINSLLTFKTIDFHPENGIIVNKKNNKKQKVDRNSGEKNFSEGDFSIDSLSSGEQHLIILLGSLIFSTKSDSLVLIDEPEISLHAAWQKKLLGLIEEISKINNFNILVATHSFTLINGNWNNTIELAELA